MKILCLPKILFVSLIIFSGCELNEEDSQKLRKATDNTVSESITQAEPRTSDQDYKDPRLTPIREQIKVIDSIKSWTAIDKRAIRKEDTKGGAAYFFLKDELRKIDLYQFNDKTRKESEFYLSNGKIFFVYEKEIDSTEYKVDPKYYEPFEDSSFFESGQLIKIKSALDCGAPFSEEFRTKEENRLKQEYDLLIRRLKRN